MLSAIQKLAFVMSRC